MECVRPTTFFLFLVKRLYPSGRRELYGTVARLKKKYTQNESHIVHEYHNIYTYIQFFFFFWLLQARAYKKKLQSYIISTAITIGVVQGF